jgi:hypothetical protein
MRDFVQPVPLDASRCYLLDRLYSSLTCTNGCSCWSPLEGNTALVCRCKRHALPLRHTPIMPFPRLTGVQLYRLSSHIGDATALDSSHGPSMSSTSLRSSGSAQRGPAATHQASRRARDRCRWQATGAHASRRRLAPSKADPLALDQYHDNLRRPPTTDAQNLRR